MYLTRMWRDHVAAGHSSMLDGVEIAGTDAVELDAEITACVSAYLCRCMVVDERLVRRLTEVSRALADKQAHAEEPVAAYCARLNEMVIAVLEESRAAQRSSGE